MIFKTGISIQGTLIIEHRRDGVLYRVDKQDNLVVNTGLQLLVDLLKGKGVSPSHIELGDDNTAAAAGQTDLQGPIAGSEVEENEGQTTFRDDARGIVEKAIVDFQTVRFTKNYPQGASNLNTENGTGEIRECGLFNRYTGGVMFSRVVLDNPFNKGFGTDHTCIWEIKINRALAFGGGNTITDKGLEIIRDVLFQREEGVKNDIHLPLYINKIAVGDDGGSPISSETSLINEIGGENGRRPVTRYDKTESGDIDFDAAAPKLILQREIQDTMFGTDTLREAGLFNHHMATLVSGEKVLKQKMFSRVTFTDIPPNTQKTLTWELIITRG